MGKTGPQCTVCVSKHRAQIEVGLTHHTPAHALAARFGVSRDAILRHSNNHLSPVQRAAILAAQAPSAIDLDALQVAESESLLANLVRQQARLQSHSELAADLGDIRGAVSAEAAITSNLSLVGKLLGQFVTRHEVRSTSVLLSPDYLNVRAALVDAQRPYPDASRAVGAALAGLETDAAGEIAAAARKPLTIEHASPPPPPPPPPC